MRHQEVSGLWDTFKEIWSKGIEDVPDHTSFMKTGEHCHSFSSIFNNDPQFLNKGTYRSLSHCPVTALIGALMAKPQGLQGPKGGFAFTYDVGYCLATCIFCIFKIKFWLIASIAGLGLGTVQAASRAFFARLYRLNRSRNILALFHGRQILCNLWPSCIRIHVSSIRKPASGYSVCCALFRRADNASVCQRRRPEYLKAVF